ncbi:MAG: hypothetical protein HYV09_32685 [Deltaproteobacteria bacterium]|nr:hypothetical protein [Deltaproteobacteria bacterium]
MNVYVESNFLLELALEQEDREHCSVILEHARTGRVRLLVPAYALLEPYETLTRRVREWERLGREVQAEFGQLRRNAQLAADVDALKELTVRAVKLARDSHEAARSLLLSAATVLPISAETLQKAEALRVSLGMELPDAVMLASVLLDLDRAGGDSLFVNKNTKDFADPSVQTELRQRRCRYIGSFGAAVAAIRAAAARDAGT